MQYSYSLNPAKPAPTVLSLFVTDDFGDNFCLSYTPEIVPSERIAVRMVPFEACASASHFADIDPDL